MPVPDPRMEAVANARKELAEMTDDEIELRAQIGKEQLAIQRRHAKEIQPIIDRQQQEMQDASIKHGDAIRALREKQRKADEDKTPVPEVRKPSKRAAAPASEDAANEEDRADEHDAEQSAGKDAGESELENAQ